MNAPTVRPARRSDVQEIVAIYNHVLRTSFAIWSERAVTQREREAWLADSAALGFPVLVAEEGSGVVGFAAAGPFRHWPGYATTAEHSIHVRPDARRRGVGTRLLARLEVELARRGTHVMVAGIDAANEESLQFHRRAGFVEVARMPEVGRVRSTWRDLLLVQKTID